MSPSLKIDLFAAVLVAGLLIVFFFIVLLPVRAGGRMKQSVENRQIKRLHARGIIPPLGTETESAVLNLLKSGEIKAAVFVFLRLRPDIVRWKARMVLGLYPFPLFLPTMLTFATFLVLALCEKIAIGLATVSLPKEVILYAIAGYFCIAAIRSIRNRVHSCRKALAEGRLDASWLPPPPPQDNPED